MNIINEENLNTKQKYAFDLLKKGHNIFLTGPGGVGKTELIKVFKQWALLQYKRISITSTTGCSAILIGGKTLHSWAGIGLGKETSSELINKISNNYKYKWTWKANQILVIDEVSMLSPKLFDKLNKIGKNIRENDNPFGGMQLILVGDFCQLPTINSSEFVFQSNSWAKCNFQIVVLDEIIRQSDPIFQKCLNEIRFGECSPETRKILETRLEIEYEDIKNEKYKNKIIPTILFPTNALVDNINKSNIERLKKNGNKSFCYKSKFSLVGENDFDLTAKNRIKIQDYVDKSLTVEDNLELVEGSQVMLTYNKDTSRGLCNGSRGVIVELRETELSKEPIVMVKFMTGEIINICCHTWEIKEKFKWTATKTQIPLKIAFAISIHKSQGMTLDLVKMNIGSKIFEYGQAYVALSRVKSLDGLYLIDFDYKKIMAHPKVIEFYKNIKNLT